MMMMTMPIGARLETYHISVIITVMVILNEDRWLTIQIHWNICRIWEPNLVWKSDNQRIQQFDNFIPTKCTNSGQALYTALQALEVKIWSPFYVFKAHQSVRAYVYHICLASSKASHNRGATEVQHTRSNTPERDHSLGAYLTLSVPCFKLISYSIWCLLEMAEIEFTFPHFPAF